MHQFKRPVKLSKRAGATFLNLVVALCFGIIIDLSFMNSSMHKVFNYDAINASYNSHLKEYRDLQDEYKLFVYDSSSNRVENTSSGAGQRKHDFYNDQRVIDLTNKLNEEDRQMTICNITIIGLDVALSTFITYTFGDLFFGIGRSLGGLINHFRIEEEDENKKNKFYKIILYGFTKWIFYVVLGFGTLFILPAISFYRAGYDEQNRTTIDKWFHYVLLVPEKYSSDE